MVYLLKSKFSYTIIYPVITFLFLSFAMYFLAKVTFVKFSSVSAYLSFIFFVFVWLWLAYGEFRTKAISVQINMNTIEIKRYFGFGSSTSYLFTDFEGYRTSILASRGNIYEYLYLMQDDKKAIKISAFYHKNYQELKEAICEQTIDLGFESFNILKEIKEVFT